MTSESLSDGVPIEVQEFEEWYSCNEKLGNQLPYIEGFRKQKDGSICLDFGFITDERVFTVLCAEGYPQICSIHVRSALDRYSKLCSVINEYITSQAGCIKLAGVFTKCLEVFSNSDQITAGPSNAQDSDFEDANLSSSEETKQDDEESDASSVENMDIDDSQFFNTDFHVRMDLRKKKWRAKEMELRKKMELESKKERQKARDEDAKKAAAAYLKASGFGGFGSSEKITINEGDMSTDEEENEKYTKKVVVPKQGQQIFKHWDATFQILCNEMISLLKDGQNDGFFCDTINDSLYQWTVKISKFPPGSRLAEQLSALNSRYGFDYIEIQLDFLPDYPFYPPLLRLVRPKFKGTLVQSLASIDLLKLTYWNPATTVREILQMIRDILIKHAEIDVEYKGNNLAESKEGAYLPIEDYLIKLALATEVTPRANFEIIPIENLQKAPQLIDQDKKSASQSVKSSTTDVGWKPGSGYGTGMIQSSRQWSPDSLVKAQEEKDRQIYSLLNKLLSELKNNHTMAESDLFHVLEGSSLIPYLETMLNQAHESCIELSRRQKVFGLIFQLCSAIADYPKLFPLLCTLPRQNRCLAYYLEKINDIMETGQKLTKKSTTATSSQAGFSLKDFTSALKRKNPDSSSSGNKDISSEQLGLENAGLVQSLWAKVSRNMAEHKQDCNTVKYNVDSIISTQDDFESLYKSKLQPLQFRACSLQKLDGCWRHHYWSNTKPKFAKEVMSIFKEWTALRSSLPLSSSTSIFACYDEDNVHLLRALIIAPDDTPYANGCFLFDIQFPETYPNAPPKVNLQTTGGNRVRFNPNLYSNGKVCLSLLGTWSGEQGEKWNSKSSTVLQVLVSIQSLIFHEQPYFNEPGYEKTLGTSKGTEASSNYNKEVRKNCANIAILDMLKNPVPNFEDVIKLHFTLKKDRVKKQLKQWLELDSSLQKTVKSINELLDRLVEPCDLPTTSTASSSR